MINIERRYNLTRIIKNDLLCYGKIPLILLLSTIASSILVVTTTYKTRQLTAEHEQMILEKNALDIEWYNLTLEENSLEDHSRIERIATKKLKMQNVDPLQENVILYY